MDLKRGDCYFVIIVLFDSTKLTVFCFVTVRPEEEMMIVTEETETGIGTQLVEFVSCFEL